PEYFEAFFFQCARAEQLPEVINAIRRLRLAEVLRSSIHIANDYKVLGGLQQYPWTETGGNTPLPPDKLSEIRKKMSFGPWNASGGLYGTKAQVVEAKRLLKKELSGIDGKLKFLSDSKLEFAKNFAGAFRVLTGWDVRKTIELVQPVIGLMKGVP